jgi:hypothetical protein
MYDLVNSERSLEANFPNAIVQRMPQYMSTILEALNNKGIICSFCAEMVLKHIGRMATNYCISHLLAMYDSKEAFVDHLIEVVCCCYIYQTVNQGENRLELSSGRFTHLLDLCKKAAKKKRIKRRHDKIYLGMLSFPSKLNRSFNEFIAIVVDMFGYLLLELQAPEHAMI